MCLSCLFPFDKVKVFILGWKTNDIGPKMDHVSNTSIIQYLYVFKEWILHLSIQYL